jgi:DNA-binding protein H-NS
MNKKLNFDAMSIDEMWLLHEEIGRLLSVRLSSEKRELEKRLAQLRRERDGRSLDGIDARPAKDMPRARRKYPQVFPKYRNPTEPSETWSGRGKQPRWLAAALKTGHTIEEFVIGSVEAHKNDKRSGATSKRAKQPTLVPL